MTAQEAVRLAGYFYLQDRYADAERVLLAQLATGEDAIVLFNLALLKQIEGKFDECTAYVERSAALAPDFHQARDLLAHQRLRDGRWEEGLRFFESRFMKPEAIAYLNFPLPVWDGSRAHRRLLIWCEQGLGDTVQFARLLPEVRARGHEVVLVAQPELVSLFRESGVADEIIPEPELVRSARGPDGATNVSVNLPRLRAAGVDAHLPIMSVGRVLGVDGLQIPGQDVFLQVSPTRRERARAQLNALCPPGARRIGLVWSGSSSAHAEFSKTARRRNAPLSDLRPIWNLPGACFLSFQLGDPAAERLEFPQLLAPELSGDYADTAALLAELDLLITVDTSIAHVAGGMGVPVWLLSRFDSCWRWLRDREDSPWYPSMRVFRQGAPGDWAGLATKLRTELTDQLGG